MIHIFDKFYITYAETSVGPDALDKMSENYIQVIDKNLVHIDHHTYAKNRLFYTKSLSELFENFDSINDFFTYIDKKLSESNIGKIILYADEKSFNEFLIRWWKGIFPNLSLNGLYSLYSNFSDSEILQMSKSASYLNIAVDSSNIPFKYFSKIYWEKSIHEIEGLSSLYQEFDIPESIIRKSSIEFRTMNFLLGTLKEEETHALLNFVANLYKKMFMSEVCGIKRMVERSIYNFDKTTIDIEGGLKLAPRSLVKEIENNSSLSFILDGEIRESRASYDYLTQKYDLIEFSKNLIELDYKMNSRLNLKRESLFQDNPCLAYYLENDNHPNFSDLLESECNGTSSFQIFKKMTQRNKVNPFLLPAFYNLIQSTDSEDKKFSKEFQLG